MTTAPGWDECWRVITGLCKTATAVKARTFDMNLYSQLPGYQVSNKSSRTPKQLQQCGRENDNYLNLLLFRLEGLWKDVEAVWMHSNSLMEKWQIPWGGMVDLDGRETACSQTYAESIAGAFQSWHTWQKWKWVHDRNWVILDELWKEWGIYLSDWTPCFTWTPVVLIQKNGTTATMVMTYDWKIQNTFTHKSRHISIWYLEKHKGSYCQCWVQVSLLISPNSIPRSKDIGDATLPNICIIHMFTFWNTESSIDLGKVGKPL